MKNFNLILSIAVVIGISFSCKSNKTNNDEATINKQEETTQQNDVSKQEETVKTHPRQIKINIFSNSGSNVSGTVEFMEKDGVVNMVAHLTGLKPGKHAIHIHENADCSAIDGKSAGGHWNPTDQPHGKWGAKTGYHRGDIGNLEADKYGEVIFKFSTDEWCVGCDYKDKNIIGKSVIIHEGVDDFTSQPSGNAGKRVACGEIQGYR